MPVSYGSVPENGKNVVHFWSFGGCLYPMGRFLKMAKMLYTSGVLGKSVSCGSISENGKNVVHFWGFGGCLYTMGRFQKMAKMLYTSGVLGDVSILWVGFGS